MEAGIFHRHILIILKTYFPYGKTKNCNLQRLQVLAFKMYFDFLYEIRIFRPNVAKFGNVNYAFHKLRGKTGASKRRFI